MTTFATLQNRYMQPREVANIHECHCCGKFFDLDNEGVGMDNDRAYCESCLPGAVRDAAEDVAVWIEEIGKPTTGVERRRRILTAAEKLLKTTMEAYL